MTRSLKTPSQVPQQSTPCFSLLDERQFRSLFEDMHLGVMVASNQGQVLMCNRAALDILGVSEKQLLGESFFDSQWRALHEDGSPCPVHEYPIAKAIAFKQSVTNRVLQIYRPLLRDWIWVLVSAKPQLGSEGLVRQVICSLSDITEQKKTEASLRESEDRYRDLVEHSQDLLCTHALDGRLLSVNAPPVRILGYEAAELLGMSIQQVLAPEFRDQFKAYLDTIRRQGEAKGVMTVVTRSGEKRLWEYHNTLRTQGVAEPIVRGLAHDITDQWRLDKAIHTLVQEVRSDSSANFFSSMAYHLARCLAADITIIGELLTEKPQMVRTLAVCCQGRATKNFTYKLANTPCQQVLKHSGCTYQSGVTKLFPKDTLLSQAGIEAFVGTPLYDSKRRTIGIMLAVYRCTLHNPQFAQAILQLFSTRTAAEVERKRTEERVKRLSQRLRQLQDEERRRISRELHDATAQKLAALKLTLGVIKRRTRGIEPKIAATISECVSLADECVHELRTFAYLLHPPLLDEFGLHAALRAYVAGVHRRSGLKLTLRIDTRLEKTRLPKPVELALFRIVQEALTNVRLHSGSKSACVDLRLGAKQSDVLLTLEDKGHGLPKDVWQAIKAGTPTLSGMGIAGMRERVSELDGQFALNTGTRGTKLTVLLPVAQAGTH